MTCKQADKLWDKFLKTAEKYGYQGHSYNDVSLGIGSTLFKEDRFVPIIKLCIWSRGDSIESMSIHVEDRNGNGVLDGPTCAVHTLNNCPDFADKFKEMCSYVFEKYSKYSRQNRLDYVYNELPEDRKNWTN